MVLAASAATAWVWWPTVVGLRSTVPLNLGDPLYFAWQLAWVGRWLTAGGPFGDVDLYSTNAFQGAPDNLAFTDTILGYAPLALVTGDGQAGALTQLNVAFLLATVLAGLGAYALARALGAGVAGSLVAGAGFAFAPWRLEQSIHLNVVSTGGMAFALALLARGHGYSFARGYEPDRVRPGLAFAGWLVAAWQLTLSFAIGIPFAYVLLLVVAGSAVGWLLARRPRVPLRVLAADLAGGAVLVGVVAVVALPYLRVVAANPEGRRTVAYVELFSPPWRALVTAPQTNRWWGDLHAPLRADMTWVPESVLLPGFVLAALALAGLVVSGWSVRRRLLLAGCALAAGVLALGTTFAGGRWTYLPLFEHAPGWEGLRVSGRLVIWVTLALCLLAAGATDAFVRAVAGLPRARPPRPAADAAAPAPRVLTAPSPRVVVAALLAAVLPAVVVAEGSGPVPAWTVSTQPVRLAGLPQPVLVLPTSQVADYHMMTWSTQGWPLLVNGGSGFEPAFQTRMRQEAAGFPSAASVAALRARGVATVVVVRSRAAGTPLAAAVDDVLPAGVRRVDLGDAVVFDLR